MLISFVLVRVLSLQLRLRGWCTAGEQPLPSLDCAAANFTLFPCENALWFWLDWNDKHGLASVCTQTETQDLGRSSVVSQDQQDTTPSACLHWCSFDLILFQSNQKGTTVTWLCLPLPAMQMFKKGSGSSLCFPIHLTHTNKRESHKVVQIFPNREQLWFRWVL